MDDDAREALVRAYRELGAAGLIAGSSGNISVRAGSGMLISPTGTSPAGITVEAVVAMALDRPAPGASSEWALHGALYAARVDLRAIVHTHSDACTALACLDEGLPAFHYEVLTFGGEDVRCAPYVTFGTPALAGLAVQAMEGRTGCLLANHGMLTAAGTLAKAVAKAHQLERLCRQYLLARGAGRPRILNEDELAAARVRLGTYQEAAPVSEPGPHP